MKMPSASQLYRAIACPASYALPQRPNVSSSSALRGTEIHSFLANQVDPTQGVLELSEETAEYVQRLDISSVLAGREVYAAEVTFLYNPKTQRASQNSKEVVVDYRNSQEFIGGTADLILKEPSDRWVILDWKTGTEVEHPSQNKQLLFFAECLRSIYGPDIEVAGEIAFLDPISGKVTVVRAELPHASIDAFVVDLIEALATMRDAELALASGQAIEFGLQTGPQCKYCPAYNLCPKQRHIAHALAAGSTQGLVPMRGSVMMMAPKEAGRAWVRLKELRQLMALVEYELRCYAEDMPIELPNGSKIVVKQRKRESLDAGIAREVLEERGGAQLASLASSYSVSKASIKRGLKEVGMPSGAKDINLLLEIMQDRGGVVVTSSPMLKTVLPSGKELEEGED